MNLKNFRKERNFTQKQLSRIMKVSQPTISKWEHKKNVPDAKTLSNLSKELKVDVNEILNCFIDEKENDANKL